MPLYDCGVPDCEECQRAFGPDRSQALAVYKARLRQQTRVYDAPAITRHYFASVGDPAVCRCGSRVEAHLYRDAKEFEREQARQSVEWP